MRALHSGYIFRRVGRSCLIRTQNNASNCQRRDLARTRTRIDASYVYEHLSKHGSKEKTERTGSNDQTGAPRSSFHYSLGYDVKLHRPVQNPGEPSGRLEPGGSGGTRPARPPVTRPAAFNHNIQLNRPRDARACRPARALPGRPRAAAFCRRPGRAMRCAASAPGASRHAF